MGLIIFPNPWTNYFFNDQRCIDSSSYAKLQVVKNWNLGSWHTLYLGCDLQILNTPGAVPEPELTIIWLSALDLGQFKIQCCSGVRVDNQLIVGCMCEAAGIWFSTSWSWALPTLASMKGTIGIWSLIQKSCNGWNWGVDLIHHTTIKWTFARGLNHRPLKMWCFNGNAHITLTSQAGKFYFRNWGKQMTC